MKYLIAIGALACVAIGIVAFATQRTADTGSMKAKIKVQGAPDMSVPKEFRLLSRQDLTTGIGQLAWQHVATFNAAGARADRLKAILTKLPAVGAFQHLSASSWIITINTVSQKQDGVHVELEIIPMLLADRRPAAITGNMKETWIIKQNGAHTECKCLVRDFDKPFGLAIF